MRRLKATLILAFLLGAAVPQDAMEVLPKTPDVRTKSLEKARQMAGNSFGSVTVVSGPQDGVVQTQDPQPNTPVRSREAVLRVWMQAKPKGWLDTLLAGLQSQQPPQGTGKQTVVPPLYGLTRAAAQSALRQAHLRSEFPEPVGDSTWGVVQSDPQTGTSDPENTLVSVTMGPVVPDLRDDTEDAAAAALSSVGLVLGHTVQSPPPGEPRTVLRQAPEAGRFILLGRPVDIWIPTRVIAVPAVPVVAPLGPTVVKEPKPQADADKIPSTKQVPQPPKPKPAGGVPAPVKWTALLLLLAAVGAGTWKWLHPGVVVWHESLSPVTAANVKVVTEPKIKMEWRASAPEAQVVLRLKPKVTGRTKGAQK